MGSRRLEPLSVHSDIEEIDTVVEGINMMVGMLENSHIDEALDDARAQSREIRNCVKPLELDDDLSIPLLQKLTRLEGDREPLHTSKSKRSLAA